MKNIGICGHFGVGKELLNGQTIKTKTLYNEMIKHYGEENVLVLDTHYWKISPIKFLYKCIKISRSCKNIMILPASRGIKILGPLFALLSRIFSIRIHYIVIGGWLPELLNCNRWLINSLKLFDGIYVETASMRKKLNVLELDNIYIVPNFKYLPIIKEKEFFFEMNPYFKFCTFSRVLKEKGIEDAIAAVQEVNKSLDMPICSLDIYGQIDPSYRNEFETILDKLPSYIKYKGEVSFDKSVEVLKNYHAMLFPTFYEGEGFAGTILDSYAAGVPIIASDWKYNSEIIINNKTGFLHKTHDIDEMVEIIKNVISDNNLLAMKKSCIAEAQKYIPENALNILYRKIE